jgi:outer membrane lipoprotein carrier protein
MIAARRARGPARCAAAAMAFLLLVFAAVVAAAASPEGEGQAFLVRVAKKYGAARALSARFRQEVPLQNVGVVRKASGKVFFERPLKMRWDYGGADAQLFMSDGEHFYFRPAGSSKIFRKKADEKSLGGKIPLLLLFGRGGEITEMFRVEEILRRKGGAETALVLVPRAGGAPEVRRVDLVAGTDDLVIREVHLYDRTGGANHLYLEGTRFDPALPEGLFRFRKPEGTEIVDG